MAEMNRKMNNRDIVLPDVLRGKSEPLSVIILMGIRVISFQFYIIIATLQDRQ